MDKLMFLTFFLVFNKRVKLFNINDTVKLYRTTGIIRTNV